MSVWSLAKDSSDDDKGANGSGTPLTPTPPATPGLEGDQRVEEEE